MFYNPAEFDFVAELENNWTAICEELEQLQAKDFIPWPEKYLYGKGWDTFGLYAFGVKIAKNCKLCPRTTALVAKVPGMVTAGFSSLAAGAHITPHTGYDDGLLRCHLGLVVPEDCALRVGPDIQRWQEGRCLVFDDTMEHEAWNRSDRTRIVLLLDFKPSKGTIVRHSSPQPESTNQDDRQKPSLMGLLKRFRKEG